MGYSDNTQIEDIRLQVVDNGFKLCFCVCEPLPSPKDNSYDNRSHDYKELVFTDAQANEAIAKMIELRDLNREEEEMEDKESDESDSPVLQGLSKLLGSVKGAY